MEEECDVIPVQSSDSTDQQEGVVVSRVEGGGVEDGELVSQVGGFGTSEGMFLFEGAFGSGSGSGVGDERSENEDMVRLVDRMINATIVLAAGTFAVSKLLTIDRDYWHVGQPFTWALLFFLANFFVMYYGF